MIVARSRRVALEVQRREPTNVFIMEDSLRSVLGSTLVWYIVSNLWPERNVVETVTIFEIPALSVRFSAKAS